MESPPPLLSIQSVIISDFVTILVSDPAWPAPPTTRPSDKADDFKPLSSRHVSLRLRPGSAICRCQTGRRERTAASLSGLDVRTLAPWALLDADAAMVLKSALFPENSHEEG